MWNKFQRLKTISFFLRLNVSSNGDRLSHGLVTEETKAAKTKTLLWSVEYIQKVSVLIISLSMGKSYCLKKRYSKYDVILKVFSP